MVTVSTQIPRLYPDKVLSVLTLLGICPFLARLRISPDQHQMGNLVVAQEPRGSPPDTFDICRDFLQNFRLQGHPDVALVNPEHSCVFIVMA